MASLFISQRGLLFQLNSYWKWNSTAHINGHLIFRFTVQTSYVVDEKFVPKVGMIFKTLEEAAKFYKHYSKLAGFSTKIRNTTQDGDKIKNQLIVCSREGRAVRGSAYMDSGLLGSPLLGRDEKHAKEREYAFIFQQVHHSEQLLETICEAIRQLPSKQRENSMLQIFTL
ncbi:hypothetical protein Ahy_B08g092669 [Arachis hypogaea]|uniref:FAR1 domain-containing protein n=1 Tax=Arachis hypogaea TaxID=3818 RepID=A0A444Y4D4_ARAHY|nr:hypothetical protein Ahy_B08g092669 [Arachis hypogaea]